MYNAQDEFYARRFERFKADPARLALIEEMNKIVECADTDSTFDTSTNTLIMKLRQPWADAFDIVAMELQDYDAKHYNDIMPNIMAGVDEHLNNRTS